MTVNPFHARAVCQSVMLHVISQYGLRAQFTNFQFMMLNPVLRWHVTFFCGYSAADTATSPPVLAAHDACARVAKQRKIQKTFLVERVDLSFDYLAVTHKLAFAMNGLAFWNEFVASQ